MVLENITTEKIETYANRYSSFSLSDMLSVNKQILERTNNELSFNDLLENLIFNAFDNKQYDACDKLIQTKNIYDLFINTLVYGQS